MYYYGLPRNTSYNSRRPRIVSQVTILVVFDSPITRKSFNAEMPPLSSNSLGACSIEIESMLIGSDSFTANAPRYPDGRRGTKNDETNRRKNKLNSQPKKSGEKTRGQSQIEGEEVSAGNKRRALQPSGDERNARRLGSIQRISRLTFLAPQSHMWRQITQIMSSLSPKRDWGPKRVNAGLVSS